MVKIIILALALTGCGAYGPYLYNPPPLVVEKADRQCLEDAGQAAAMTFGGGPSIYYGAMWTEISVEAFQSRAKECMQRKQTWKR